MAKKVIKKKSNLKNKVQKSNLKKKVVKKKIQSKAKKNAAPTFKKSLNKKEYLNEGALLSPLGNKVLVLKNEAFEKTTSGLFIPVTAQEKPAKGKVVAVGPGEKNKRGVLRPLDVQIGDNVIYEKYAGLEIKLNGNEYLILSETEIIGVIN